MKTDWWFLLSVGVCCASAVFMCWVVYRFIRM
jgi:hypothetical protein